MKAFIHRQHLELFLLRMVLITSVCWKFCLEDYQSRFITRLSLHCDCLGQPLKHSKFLFKNICINFSPSYVQALKKISKFVRTNILPGAIAEVGLLCCACVHSNPEEAVVSLIEPILSSVISSLKGTPVTGFGGSGICDPSVSAKVYLTL